MPMPSLAAAVALAASPIHVALVFAPGHCVPAAIQQAAIAEAAIIWSPYGVVVTAAEPPRAERPADVTLQVEMSVAPAGAVPMWWAPLGAVDFDAGGAPLRIVTIFIARLLAMLEDVRLGDIPAWRWPHVIREQIVGRALGRILAHEIGHVLLRTTRHAPRGLMRAVQRADELVDPARGRYRLRD